MKSDISLKISAKRRIDSFHEIRFFQVKQNMIYTLHAVTHGCKEKEKKTDAAVLTSLLVYIF